MLTLLVAISCQEKVPQGKLLYKSQCANCHMEDGTGLEGLIPPLAQADVLAENQNRVACWIRHGMNGPIVVNGRPYEGLMEPNTRLNAIEITNIINYINGAWGNAIERVTIETVEQQLDACQDM